MDEHLAKVHKDIYAIVASVQGGCQASKILYEYRENYGFLDFRRPGHQNLNEFLDTVPKIFMSRNAIGEVIYKAKLGESEAARDIQFQVSLQKAPDRDHKSNFQRSLSTRGQRPQSFQRQSRYRSRSSYGAAFATSSSQDNQNRILHSSWLRTIEDGQKTIPRVDEVLYRIGFTDDRIHNGFVQNRDFSPPIKLRPPPLFEQNYDNVVQHSTRYNSGYFSQHSRQNLEKPSINNSNLYRQNANRAPAVCQVSQGEAQQVSKTSQLLQSKEIKAECKTSATKSERSSARAIALFNWGKKRKEEPSETPLSLNERSPSQGVNKSQIRNESTEIKYHPVTTSDLDGLTSRIDSATTPLVDYSFSDDSVSEENVVLNSSSVENIAKREPLETTQITTATSAMNDVKSNERVMIDLQQSMENEPESLPNLAAQPDQVIDDLQENTKNESKALPSPVVQQTSHRQAEAYERWKAKLGAIIHRAVTDFGPTQQNHTPAIDRAVSSPHERKT